MSTMAEVDDRRGSLDRTRGYESFRNRAAIFCDNDNKIIGIDDARLSSLTSVDENNEVTYHADQDDGMRDQSGVSTTLSKAITRSKRTILHVIQRAAHDNVVTNMLLQKNGTQGSGLASPDDNELSARDRESSSRRKSTSHLRNAGKYTVIAFVNSTSGGGKGKELLRTLQSLLGNEYVIDLHSCGPGHMPEDTLLQYALDPLVRILACGGDGTCGWIYSSLDNVWSSILGMKGRVHLSDQYKDHLPLAIMPLGTGNDLSRQYNWGKRFQKRMTQKSMVSDVVNADLVGLDRWRLLILPTSTLREDEKEFIPQIFSEKDSIHHATNSERTSLATLSKVAAMLRDEDADSKKGNKLVTQSSRPSTEYFDGLFCNYFSLGFDATVLLEFHKERTKHPEKFTSPMKNKLVYVEKSPIGVRAPKLRKRVQIFVNNKEGELVRLKIPRDTRDIILLNIQSYAGGNHLATKGSSDDGLIEVIFVSNLIRMVASAVVGPVVPYALFNVRAQTNRVVIKTKCPLHCQVDGEPWLQGEAMIQVSFHTRNAILMKSSDGMNCGCGSGSNNVVIS